MPGWRRSRTACAHISTPSWRAPRSKAACAWSCRGRCRKRAWRCRTRGSTPASSTPKGQPYGSRIRCWDSPFRFPPPARMASACSRRSVPATAERSSPCPSRCCGSSMPEGSGASPFRWQSHGMSSALSGCAFGAASGAGSRLRRLPCCSPRGWCCVTGWRPCGVSPLSSRPSSPVPESICRRAIRASSAGSPSASTRS